MLSEILFTLNENEKLEEKITSKTKVILAQNTFGLSSDLDPILTLAKKYGIKAKDYSCLKNWQDYDTVILATSYQGYLIKEYREQSEKNLLIDLSVPRNVDPSINQHNTIYLYNIDTLHRLVQKTNTMRFYQIDAVDDFINESVQRQMEIFYAKERYGQLQLACVG